MSSAACSAAAAAALAVVAADQASPLVAAAGCAFVPAGCVFVPAGCVFVAVPAVVAADQASPVVAAAGCVFVAEGCVFVAAPAVVAADQASPVVAAAGCVLVAAAQALSAVFRAFAERVADDHVWSALPGRVSFGAGRAGGRRLSPVIADTARIRWATPVAMSPALLARRAAVTGLGSRVAAIALHTGHTQHSALPVAQRPPPFRFVPV
ncbi:hypothetical protein ACQP2X_09380 [Actinoplanes sp. CA-131856]